MSNNINNQFASGSLFKYRIMWLKMRLSEVGFVLPYNIVQL